jgi:hypothetical protein
MREITSKRSGRSARPVPSWHHWTGFRQVPRPRLFSAEIECAIYKIWTPKRQTALLRENPKAQNNNAILRPIAARAWWRDVQDGELESIVRLVQALAPNLGHV